MLQHLLQFHGHGIVIKGILQVQLHLFHTPQLRSLPVQEEKKKSCEKNYQLPIHSSTWAPRHLREYFCVLHLILAIRLNSCVDPTNKLELTKQPSNQAITLRSRVTLF